MRQWHIARSWLRSVVWRGRRELELSEELRFHLERETERLQAGGLQTHEEARLRALRLFGGVEPIREACREARGTAALDTLARDTRYGVRRLTRDWRFTMAAVLILGLAIGANTAIFSLVNAVLFREQTVVDPGRLVNAIGRSFRLEGDPGSWTVVIGVVRDTGTGRFDDDVLDPIAPPFYRSYTQTGASPTTVLARASGDAAALVAAMQRELRAVDVTLPVMTAQTMAQRLEASQAEPAVVAAFLASLGGLGLVLFGIGLYAVVAFAVTRRTREIGIRMALGAGGRQVVWSIARGVAGLVGVGTSIGLVLSVLAMLALRASSSGDIGVGTIAVYPPSVDPLALAAIAAVTAVVGVAAAFVPGRRATLMDPLVALRHE